MIRAKKPSSDCLDDAHPASTSARVTQTVIRDDIGFDGLLMSDDLSMKALTGAMRNRAEAVIRAGSDVALHCNGDMTEMRAAAEGVPSLGGAALARFARAFAVTAKQQDFDQAVAVQHLAGLMAQNSHIA